MSRSLPSASAPLLTFVEVILCEYHEDCDAEEDSDYDVDEDDADVSNREILIGGAASLKTIELNGICLYDCIPPLSVVTTLHMYGTVKGPLPYTTFCVIFSSLPTSTHLYLYHYSVELRAGRAPPAYSYCRLFRKLCIAEHTWRDSIGR